MDEVVGTYKVPGVDGDHDGVEALVRDDIGRQVFGVRGDHVDAVVSGPGQAAAGSMSRVVTLPAGPTSSAMKAAL
ncbi:hypothetical protein QMK24_34705 [Streptomyces sp. PH10-H1]|nr:hypothetical protein [Streptomyces sp. PH10-H1]